MDLNAQDQARIKPYVTSVEGPVFALTGLPEVVKGALFARYSRSAKSLRRLLLDEFLVEDGTPVSEEGPGSEHAEALYDRVLTEYGDDSVAQLGAAHVAVEGVSNVLTKVLQWGRLASYLEQSTRYIAYTDKPGGHWRYHVPDELGHDTPIAAEYRRTLDHAFEIYSEVLPIMVDYWDQVVPADARDAAHARAVKARALDSVRGLLPAATTSNMGIMASGQAYEALIVRLRSHPLAEARAVGDQMLTALRQVIPAFLTRTDRPDRGERYGAYMRQNAEAMAALADRTWPDDPEPAGAEVRLLDFDPDGEERVVAHALWPHSGQPLSVVRRAAAQMSAAERRDVLAVYRGHRLDRREKPGRALEATHYTFEIVCDYGAYRDLQRHRLNSLQVQPLNPHLGWHMPEEVESAGIDARFRQVMEESAALHAALETASLKEIAPYAVSLAHRIRFTMTMNARQAMHVIELRSQPQGHIAYRRVAQQMHRAIDAAGHHAIAEMMTFTDHSGDALGRLAAERRSEEGISTLRP